MNTDYNGKAALMEDIEGLLRSDDIEIKSAIILLLRNASYDIREEAKQRKDNEERDRKISTLETSVSTLRTHNILLWVKKSWRNFGIVVFFYLTTFVEVRYWVWNTLLVYLPEIIIKLFT